MSAFRKSEALTHHQKGLTQQREEPGDMWGCDRWQHRLAGMQAVLTNDEGQALIEYALVLALIAIVSIAALKALGADMSFLLNRISSQMASVSNP